LWHESLFSTFCFLATTNDNTAACVCDFPVCMCGMAHTHSRTRWERLLFNLWSRARKNCALWRFHNEQSAKGNG